MIEPQDVLWIIPFGIILGAVLVTIVSIVWAALSYIDDMGIARSSADPAVFSGNGGDFGGVGASGSWRSDTTSSSSSSSDFVSSVDSGGSYGGTE